MLEGSKPRSFTPYEVPFCSCIASDLVACWGLEWKLEGDGCATGASASARYRVEASYALNSDEPGICDHDAETLCGCGVNGKKSGGGCWKLADLL
jgi:hypothetical protein